MGQFRLIEESLGRNAEIDFLPMRLGGVKETFADIDAIRRDTGYEPTMPIDVGVPKFVEWLKAYEGV